MMRSMILLLLCLSLLCADIFDQKCVACHKARNVPLKPIFFNYLLYYSSEQKVKEALKRYLLHPKQKKRLTPKKYQKNNIFTHHIDKKNLEKILQIYWDRYKVIGKIR